MLFRRLLSMLLAVSMAAATLFPYGDAYTPGTFPIIGIDEKADDAVRVMSFNIRCYGVGDEGVARRRLIALEEILRVAPDSLGVQEATGAWMFWLRMLPQYGIVGKCRDGGISGEHCPVLYNREKYRLIDADTFWLSETPDEVSYGWDAACRRVCTWVLLENRESGVRYAHVNTHFDNVGKTAVKKSAEQISAFIAERFPDVPVVFTADLNAEPDSVAYEIMTRTLSDTRLTAPDCQSFGTYHDAAPQDYSDCIIDYVLCSQNVTPLVFRTVTEGVNGRFVSDHFPIYADVTFAAQ